MTNIKILDIDLPVRLEWLRSFLAVADQGGFSKAARHLHLSQPAVSTHVKELEENLGSRLFEHARGKVRLTRSGEAAAAEARRILEGVRILRTSVNESEDSVKGPLSLGASTTPGNYILPPIMSEFERQYPKARTALSIGNTSKIMERLAAHEVDLGLVGLKPTGDEFVSKPLCDDEIVVFASADHPLARKKQLTPVDLAYERFIIRESDSATRRMGDAWFLKFNPHPHVMVLGCPETVKRAVAAGLGIGVLSRFAIEWEIGQKRLVPLRVPGFPLKRTLHVVYLRRKHLTRTMITFLTLLEKAKRPE